jgi:hypothetical protein
MNAGGEGDFAKQPLTDPVSSPCPLFNFAGV